MRLSARRAPRAGRSLATGSQSGYLQTWDLERLAAGPTWDVKAHASLVHAIDGVGGRCDGHGAPEIVTGGMDGCVRVWDPRQRDAPVAAFEPPAAGDDGAGAPRRECWAVAFGDAYDAQSRCVAAGYDNGDVKVFDLRAGGAPRLETNLRNGVCALAFDRAEVAANKLLAACLEGALHALDMRTLHPVHGAADAVAQTPAVTTLWGARPLPQNRELCAVPGGSGALWLYGYSYPDGGRSRQDPEDGRPVGVPGTLRLLAARDVSTQPVTAFDWSPDKEGLAVCGALDQCVRVLAVTRLNKV